MDLTLISGLTEYINALDRSILLAINGANSSLLDPVMMTISNKWASIPLYLLLLYILLKTTGIRNTCIVITTIIVAVTLADQLCGSLIRPLVERMRPSNPDNPLSQYIHIVNGYTGGRYGFPSCHAANSVAVTTVVGLTLSRNWLTTLLIAWSLLLCYTRMYLGVHYPTDLLVGLMIGTLAGATACYAVSHITAKLPRITDYLSLIAHMLTRR